MPRMACSTTPWKGGEVEQRLELKLRVMQGANAERFSTFFCASDGVINGVSAAGQGRLFLRVRAPYRQGRPATGKRTLGWRG